MADARITDIKLMVVGDGGGWNLIRVETDQGVWGLGEAYWGPGLGIELNPDVVKAHLAPGEKYWE